jgi:hypothetical protein
MTPPLNSLAQREGPARVRASLSLLAFVLTLALPGCRDAANGPSGTEVPSAVLQVPAAAQDLTPLSQDEWVQLVTRLSEAGGFFDTDNLISNETSYLHVLGPMRRMGVEGGAYIGVGPDQNFAYIAQQRPYLAFVIDLRRDNLIYHLLLKALFHEADSRAEYLALLFGRQIPEDSARWHTASVSELLEGVAAVPGGAGSPQAEEALSRVRARVETFGLELGVEGWSTLIRFHQTFIEEGAGLRFTSFGRPARPFYPTFGELLTETDLEGEAGSYLARRDDFLFLKALQEANRVIPVVGDLAGPSALRAVGDEIRSRSLTVRVLYTSNVEYFLWGAGTFPTFAATVAELPMDEHSVLVRSVFPNTATHPHTVPGYYSTQTLVPLEEVRRVVRGSGYRGYQDLVVRDAVDPRPGGA